MNKYTQRSTATLQAHRAFLMLLTRSLTREEELLLLAIDGELTARNVLSLGLGL